MRNIPYHEVVGPLMYASLGMRPDIAYAVQTVSQFSTNPGVEHWDAVIRIFHYLKGMKEMWLSYGGQQRELQEYADADGSMAEDRRAISGYTFIIHGIAVSWSAKRQEIVSLRASMWLQRLQPRRPSGFVLSSHSFSTSNSMPPHCFPIINQQLP
jgi:hypothetical protein